MSWTAAVARSSVGLCRHSTSSRLPRMEQMSAERTGRASCRQLQVELAGLFAKAFVVEWLKEGAKVRSRLRTRRWWLDMGTTEERSAFTVTHSDRERLKADEGSLSTWTWSGVPVGSVGTALSAIACLQQNTSYTP